MNTGLIIKREYLTRVKTKQFLITTLLVPLILIITLGVVIGISMSSKSVKTVAVIDESQLFVGKFDDSESLKFDFINAPLDSVKENLEAMKYAGVLHIPAFNPEQKTTLAIWGNEQIGVSTQNKIQSNINKIIEENKLTTIGISSEALAKIKEPIVTITQQIGKDNKESDNKIANIIAYACGMILYFLMVIYGVSVMRSVMEEKTNRIAEIIISSVKPFELMMGKIIGVALVGLTQFALWIVLVGVIGIIGASLLDVSQFIGNPELMKQVMEAQQMGGANMNGMQLNITDSMVDLNTTLTNTNWGMILGWFAFYFISGYFLYASLFAAVGSLVDDDSQDSNSLTMPITMPIFIAFLIMIKALDDPNSGIAIFGSIFPLTSPIVMMARIPFNAPTWYELLASAVCMIAGFMLTTALAAKIYRTGILLNGKKITLKEVGKWIFRKG